MRFLKRNKSQKGKLTMKRELVRRLTIGMAMAVLSGLLVSGPTTVQAQRGAGFQSQMQGRPLKSRQDIESLKSGDLVAMACPKCKTITMSYVEEGRGANKPTKVGATHICPGCKTTIETVGVGKNATDEVKHVCQKCGSDMAYCCSIKKEELTKGMEEAAGAEKTPK
jgi:hypothetical protein